MTDFSSDLIFSKPQLQRIAQTVLRTSRSDVVRVQVRHTVQAVTRIAKNRVLTSDNGSRLTITIRTRVGARQGITFRTNQADDVSLQTAIVRLDALAREQIGGASDYFYVPDQPQTYLPVHLWHDSTVNAIRSTGETVVPQLIRTLQEANLHGSAFVGLMAQRIVVQQQDGLTAFGEETDSECTVSARMLDGKASGWHGQAARDWTMVQPNEIAQQAVEMAKRGANASAVEPGRRTAILSSFALAQVMRHLSRGFDAYLTNVPQKTVFSLLDNPERRNKIDLRVVDPRLSITSNPADVDGGYFPFGDLYYDGCSMPTHAMRYVQHGILQDLAYGMYYGLGQGKPFNQNPWSMRMDTMPGTTLMTLEEMIANCKEGIYVNRFSNIDELDPITGMQTGVTRDGCFLVKNGKIDRPVKNFRFTDSPMYFLNRLVAIGASKRAALGFTPPVLGEPNYASEWPRRPLIMPPVMVNDFNFSALSDAI